jgi:hypothetical protein
MNVLARLNTDADNADTLLAVALPGFEAMTRRRAMTGSPSEPHETSRNKR